MSGRIRVSAQQDRTVDGITFDSAAEARRYGELKLLEHAGEIQSLELQPTFELQPAMSARMGTLDGRGEYNRRFRAITYTADFSYRETRRPGLLIVEDVKGHRTQVYELKRKLFLYRYGDDLLFRETMA
jgi:hypothetical protein